MAELTITDKTFVKDVEESDIPVLVDFWAPWCGPCKIVGPIVEEIAKEFEGKVKVGKVNVDENTETAGKFGVMSIPTIAIFQKGKLVKAMVGVQDKKTLQTELNKLL